MFPRIERFFLSVLFVFVPIASGQIKSSPPAPGDHPVYTQAQAQSTVPQLESLPSGDDVGLWSADLPGGRHGLSEAADSRDRGRMRRELANKGTPHGCGNLRRNSCATDRIIALSTVGAGSARVRNLHVRCQWQLSTLDHRSSTSAHSCAEGEVNPELRANEISRRRLFRPCARHTRAREGDDEVADLPLRWKEISA